MKYKQLTDAEKERIFAEDVLGLVEDKGFVNFPHPLYHGEDGAVFQCRPLVEIHTAMLGVEKFPYPIRLRREDTRDAICGKKHAGKWYLIVGYEDAIISFMTEKYDTPQEAIVEVCIKISRPDLFEDNPTQGVK